MKTIVVTGGSRGIGRAVGILAGSRGWNVAVNYRSDAAMAAETVEAIVVAGGQAIALSGDVANEADVIAVFEAALARFGRIDGVVANAGIVASAQPLVEMDYARLKRMFEVNVLGTYLTARQAARVMSRAHGGQGGSFVLVSSAAARLGSPNEYVDYAGSKAALDTLAIGLSKELGPEGVRVNSVRPGLIETEIHASGGQPDRAERLGRQTPLGRPGRAEEVAEAILFLLEDASSYVTGSILDVTGGR
jgi:NAD(P)-dependent dehydrogenase (short-subunit alcohol dehydrogenase family)